MAGLRRNEIDKLPWTAFRWNEGVIRIQATKFFRPKSRESEGDVLVDPELLEIFRGCHAWRKGDFVIESDCEPTMARHTIVIVAIGKVALYQLSYTRVREEVRVISGLEMSIHDSRQSLVRASHGEFRAPKESMVSTHAGFPCCGCFVEAARVNKSLVYLFSFITAKLVHEPDEIVEARPGPQGRRIHFLLAGAMGGISSRSADAPQCRRRAPLARVLALTGQRFYPLTKAVRRWQIDWILFGGYNLPG
jgi:hypothetical protein